MTAKSTPNTSMVLSRKDPKYTLTFPTIVMETMFNHYRVVINKRDFNTIKDFIDNDTELSLSYNCEFDKSNVIVKNVSLIQTHYISGKIEDTGMHVGEKIIGYKLFAEAGEYVQLTFEQPLSKEDEIRMFD